MANWSPREENLPAYEERPMSSTKWRAAVFDIYEKLNYLRNFYDETGNPPNSPNPGNLWFDQDENALKVWNGSDWGKVVIEGLNSSPSPTPYFLPIALSTGKLDEGWLPSASTIAQGIVRMATNGETDSGALNDVAISPSNLHYYMSAFSIGDASTTVKGVIRIATSEEADEGVSNLTAMTPYRTRQVVDAAINEAGFPTPSGGFPGNAVVVNETGTDYVLKDIVSESANMSFVYSLIFGG